MDALFRMPSARRRDPAVETWFSAGDPLRQVVRPWFEALRACGDDVREIFHDGRPTVCAGDAAFAYVDAFTAHANLGFFYGAELDDPTGLLTGAGKRMRHARLVWGQPPDEAGLRALIAAAYRDIQRRMGGA